MTRDCIFILWYLTATVFPVMKDILSFFKIVIFNTHFHHLLIFLLCFCTPMLLVGKQSENTILWKVETCTGNLLSYPRCSFRAFVELSHIMTLSSSLLLHFTLILVFAHFLYVFIKHLYIVDGIIVVTNYFGFHNHQLMYKNLFMNKNENFVFPFCTQILVYHVC